MKFKVLTSLAIVVSLAVVFSLVFTDLVPHITSLNREDRLVAAVLPGFTNAVSAPAFIFTKNLKLGDRNIDVYNLQVLLNKDPQTQITITGTGSPGKESNYFGLATQAAVKKFQEKYHQEILAPSRLTKGTGSVGPATIKKLNQISKTIANAPAIDFSVSPESAQKGSRFTLTWSTKNVDSCRASGGWSGNQSLQGTFRTSKIKDETLFILTCTGPNGTTGKSVQIAFDGVNGSSCPLPVFTSKPSVGVAINKNFSYTLKASHNPSLYSVTGLTSNLSYNNSKKEIKGVFTKTGTYTFNITATNQCGSVTNPLVVTVSTTTRYGSGGSGGPGPSNNPSGSSPTPATAPTLTFSADSSSLSYNTVTNLSWSSSNATSCTASDGWTGSKGTSGTESTGSLISSRTFTLTCSGAGGDVSKSINVAVAAPPSPPTVNLSVDQTSVPYNTSVTLTWSSTGATLCTASGTGWSGNRAYSGEEGTLPLVVSKTFTMTCTNVGGSTSQSVAVTVGAPPTAGDDDLATVAMAQMNALVAGKTAPSFAGSPPYPNSIVNIFKPDGSRNDQIWVGNNIDLTCIPRNSNTNGVLITKRDMIFAKHYGSSYPTFVDNNGVATEKSFSAVTALADTDITVATLDSDVPAGITPCPILPANLDLYTPYPIGIPEGSRYPLVFTNQDRTLLIGEVLGFGTGINGGAYVGPATPANLSPWYYTPRIGDSGAAIFLLIDGKLGLFTNWWGVGVGPPTFRNIDQINAALAANGSPYTVQTMDLSAYRTY